MWMEKGSDPAILECAMAEGENDGYDHPCSLECRKADYFKVPRKLDLASQSEDQCSLWGWGKNQGVGNSENEYCVRKARVRERLNPWGTAQGNKRSY